MSHFVLRKCARISTGFVAFGARQLRIDAHCAIGWNRRNRAQPANRFRNPRSGATDMASARRPCQPGDQVGRLTLVSKPYAGHWLCECACGNGISVKVTVRASSLQSGATRSCGCLRREVSKAHGRARAANMAGSQHGELYVMERDEERGTWLCLCSCGEQTFATTAQLRSGTKRSCGCLRKRTNDERRAKKRSECTCTQSTEERRLTSRTASPRGRSACRRAGS